MEAFTHGDYHEFPWSTKRVFKRHDADVTNARDKARDSTWNMTKRKQEHKRKKKRCGKRRRRTLLDDSQRTTKRVERRQVAKKRRRGGRGECFKTLNINTRGG